jgi:hypothetical protein
MARIEDGTGFGYVAGVTSTNRLLTSSESVPSLAIASATRSDAFVVNTDTGTATGLITGLVAGTESGVLYIANASPFPLSLGGLSAGSTGAGVWKIYKDVTGGTLLSAGTPTTPSQLNVASSKPFTGSAIRANASGQTVTGGTVVALGYVTAGFNELQLAGALILGQSKAIALTFTPIGANADVTASVICAYLAG